MLAEQQRRSLCDDVQYLTDRQLERLVEQMPDNDINDYEDLQSGGWARGRWAGLGPMGISGHRHRQGPREGVSAKDCKCTAGIDLGSQINFKESANLQRQMP